MVELISIERTIPLRKKVLRPNQPIEACRYPHDALPDSFHLGEFCEKDLVGIVSLYREGHDYWPKDELIWRLRGMAVEPDLQKIGIGRKLIEAIFEEVLKRGGGRIWCNARTSALDFYRKFGFETFGDEFSIVNSALSISKVLVRIKITLNFLMISLKMSSSALKMAI